ncbi:LysR substrate-binding domain-containing protein, partial [Escherichia coli]|uniref:LysR substrate-binding domain-containing protein n=1 Tax=Escherichia coli TaxID=562 RepID=UPI0028DD70A6
LHHPRDLVAVEDANLLAQGSPHALQPWRLAGRQRTLLTPALSADTLLSLRDAALAGVGLACLPLAACVDQLRSGALLRACPDEHP